MIRRHFWNDQAGLGQGCPESLEKVIPVAARRQARTVIGGWSGYQPTELRSLGAIAEQLELGAVFYKDEESRFEISSFKALGGAYAVQCLLRDVFEEVTGRSVTLEDVERNHHPDLAADVTVVTATDGNHGRSVAWGAERFGCGCVIHMHEQVSLGRQAAVEAFGATVRRVPGNYDDSVRAAARDAALNGWFVVSDTSWPGYEDIPRSVMAGYTVMSSEAMEQWPLDAPPTHVFLQGGCGGMAASISGPAPARTGLGS